MELRDTLKDDIANEYTIYRKVTTVQSNGLWPASDPRKTLPQWYSGVTDYIIRGNDDTHYLGRAVCSKVDHFCRAEGRAISRYWAEIAMTAHKYATPLPQPPEEWMPPYELVYIMMYTHGRKTVTGWTILRNLDNEWISNIFPAFP